MTHKNQQSEFTNPPFIIWILAIIWMSYASYRYGVQSTKEKYDCTIKTDIR